MTLRPFIIVLLSLSLLSVGIGADAAKAKKKISGCTDTEQYTCLRVKSGQSWQKLFPDERERGIVMRVNHRNGQIWEGMVIKVPNNLASTSLLDQSPLPQQIDPPDEKMVVVNLGKHAWGAYDPDGRLVRWGPATGGKDYCPDIGQGCRTKSGEFRVYSLGSSRCVSSKFPVGEGGAPMPYCMFFNGGQALHGSPGGVIRGNESHGCVRMFVDDAEWLRYDFVQGPSDDNDYRGTKVIVSYDPDMLSPNASPDDTR